MLQDALPILGLFAAIVFGKFIIIFLTALVMKLPLRVCILAGAALAQVGEFSFVLLHAAEGTNLLEASLAGNLLVAVILSMLVTPFALFFGPYMASGIGKVSFLSRLFQVRLASDMNSAESLRDHVIIAGYGLTGQELAKSLKDCRKPFIIVDLNIDNVKSAMAKAEPACFGDVTSIEVLKHVGVMQAKMLVISINDHDAVIRAIGACRSVAPDIQIIARARFVVDIEPLKKAGATRIIASETAAAVEVVRLVVENLDDCDIASQPHL